MKTTITESLLVPNHEVLTEFAEWYASTSLLSEEELADHFTAEDYNLINSFEDLYNLLCTDDVQYMYNLADENPEAYETLESSSEGMSTMILSLYDTLEERGITLCDTAHEFEEIRDTLLDINQETNGALVEHLQTMQNGSGQIESLYIAIKELQVAEQQKKIQEDIEVLKNQPTFEGMDALLESINSTLAVINEQKMRTNDDKLFVIVKTVNGKEEIITEIMAKSAGDAKRSFLQKGTNAMDYDEKHISAKVKIK